MKDKFDDKIEEVFSCEKIKKSNGIIYNYTDNSESEVKLFILNYERFSREITDFPDWLPPMLSSFVSGIKELHDEIIRLEKKV